MTKKVRHVLGISGGKDSAALAIYMKDNYPDLNIEYYTADTGKELKETYQLINNLEVYLGKKILRLRAFDNSPEAPFDHKLKSLGGFLPNTLNRWCTKNLKLDVFERFVGDDPVISYVGIRGDEAREGYISTKSTIQSIFPFRQNIWSEEIIKFVLDNKKTAVAIEIAEKIITGDKLERFKEILNFPVSEIFTREIKLKQLLDLSTKDFNKLTFQVLKLSNYPVAKVNNFTLIDNEDVLKIDDIFKLLNKSGVGIPAYYNDIEFEVAGQRATYNRSRSGCYFCFFQQKIEWVWLYEQHPDLFEQAMEYERSDFKWNMEESLSELISPKRIEAIKLEYIKRKQRSEKNAKSSKLVDILESRNDFDLACASCFI